VFSIISALLPLTSLSLADQIIQFGMWVYLLVFFVLLLASTIIGGTVPDNTFLLLTGAIAAGDGLSIELLFIAAVAGGFVGYEINYWSGRLFGDTVCKRRCPAVLNDTNIKKALDLMDTFGPVSLILSRFLPVLNLPSFLAGVNAMKYRKYVAYNIFSAVIWCTILITTGYSLGNVSLIGAYLDYITDIFIAVTLVTIIIAIVMFARDFKNGT